MKMILKAIYQALPPNYTHDFVADIQDSTAIILMKLYKLMDLIPP